MRTGYSVEQVFTPTSPAQANFVDRKQITNQLVDALRTPGKQLVVYGESGSGKSTLLLNKLRQVYMSRISLLPPGLIQPRWTRYGNLLEKVRILLRMNTVENHPRPGPPLAPFPVMRTGPPRVSSC